MKKKISVWILVLFIALAIITTFLLTFFLSIEIFNYKVLDVKEKEKTYAKIAEIDDVIKKYYVDEINIDDVIENSATGMVAGLHDRYSRYLNKEKMSDYMDSSSGTLVGIGITVRLNDQGYMDIMGTYDNSPAKESGLEKGDIIIKVDGEDVKDLGYEKAVNAVKGKEGTYIELTVRRSNQDTVKKIKRRKIEVTTVRSRMIGTKGYIRILEFNQSTIDQFNKSLKSVMDSGATGLIFDVRGNPGGTLDSVVSILDTLLPEGVIVSATYKGGKSEILAESDAKEINLPMVVLANEETASAGELFTAALKDYEKAKVVGMKTFGKGVMQTLIPLKDGTGVNLTTAYFNPPKSGNFNTKGIMPDYEILLSQQQMENLDSLNETNDPQLMKAIEILGK